MANRSDKRGHWPRGKSRNAPRAPRGWESVAALLAAVNAHLAERETVNELSLDSRHSLAEELGVARSTLRYWLKGRRAPTTEACKQLAAWLRARKKR